MGWVKTFNSHFRFLDMKPCPGCHCKSVCMSAGRALNFPNSFPHLEGPAGRGQGHLRRNLPQALHILNFCQAWRMTWLGSLVSLSDIGPLSDQAKLEKEETGGPGCWHQACWEALGMGEHKFRELCPCTSSQHPIWRLGEDRSRCSHCPLAVSFEL